jgi:hypothetical protein
MEKDPAARYQTGEDLARELSELRTNKTAPNAPIAAPRAATATDDNDMTLIGTVPTVPTAPTTVVAATAVQPVASTVQPVASTPASMSKGKMWIAAAGIVAVAASAGFYLSRARQRPVPPVVATSSVPAPASVLPPALPPTVAVTSSEPVTAPPPSPVNTPIAGPANPAPKTVAGKKPKAAISSPSSSVPAKNPTVAAEPKAAASLPAVVPPVVPKIEPLGFDPKTLDPKQNAKLKIDADKMPKGLDFTVEMNGKVYSHNSGGSGQESFVPPGVQEFRVSAKKGAVQQTSNTVSADFVQKKKRTLKVELRLKGQPESAGMPMDLYSESQIVITLK